ncbi:MAG: hypothetical protein ACRD15_19545 [Vicinamibacterales bacterium]
MPGWTGRLVGRALVLVAVLAFGSDRGFAQGPVGQAATAATSAYVSASGVMIVGFPHEKPIAEAPVEARSLLPAGFEIPASARPLVEAMWRSSPTFRRQCARLAEASVLVVLTFDFPRQTAASNAESTITRTPRMQARIRMRIVDPAAPEHLAHEIEHILEQVDQVDLVRAVGQGVHGAYLVQKPAVFETARAIAVGRQVAREVREGRGESCCRSDGRYR